MSGVNERSTTGRFSRAIRAARRELRAPRPVEWTVVDPAREETRFDGRHVAVVGAAGMIGREIVRAYLARGATVHAVDVDSARLAQLAASERGGGRVLRTTTLDLCDIDGVVDVGRRIEHLDVLIFAAAGNDLVGAVEAIEPSVWHEYFDAQVVGPASLIGAVRPALKRARGSVVFLSSVHGRVPSPWPAYSTAKAALDHLVEDLALQLAADAIRVNTVVPGLVLPADDKERRRAKLAQPLGASAIPVEAIVHAVQFLADPERSPMTTGAHLVVDAGNRLTRQALADEAVLNP